MTTCAACGKVSDTLKICTGCRTVKYCNSTCQKAHRSAHKKICKKYKVYIYTGEEDTSLFINKVIRAKVDPSVTVIPQGTFSAGVKLEEIELCEGLLEIGDGTFECCESLGNIVIPSTVTTIGMEAFAHTQITILRIPPLVTEIPFKVADKSPSLFSVELSENITELEERAFMDSKSLRNIALPANCEIGDAAFFCCSHLRLLSDADTRDGVESEIVNALKHRFDGLPIHKMLYYQSYNSVAAEVLESVCEGDASGDETDTLGMTPLHILACSTVQDLGLYKVLIGKYPQNLISEDKWGALPLLYVVWGNVSDEIVQFLVERYQTIYPEYKFDWTMMIERFGQACVPRATLQRLVDTQQEFFSTQGIDWSTIMQKATNVPTARNNYDQTQLESFKSLLKCKIKNRLSGIGLKAWRDEILVLIESMHDMSNPNRKLSYDSCRVRSLFISQIESKLGHYEREYHNLKETIAQLELVLWKKRVTEHAEEEGGIMDELNRSMGGLGLQEVAVEGFREQCRITSQADIVVEHVLPYLVPVKRKYK